MNDLGEHIATVWARWQRNAEKKPDGDAIIHWTADGEPFRWTYSSLMSAAHGIASALDDYGIRQGEVCAIITRHNKLTYPLYLACVCVGAIPAMLAYPNPRLHPDKFRDGLAGMSQRSGLDWIFTERDLEPIIRPFVEASAIKGLLFPFEWGGETPLGVSTQGSVHDAMNASAPLLLQHSSGTTGLQKPVLLSNSAVLKHIENYAKAIRLSADDKIVSWLPLYHDMGLIAAFHLPLAFGIPTVQIDPFEWVLLPSVLFEAVSREQGTISWLPNFAYDMMADKIRDEDLEAININSWRLVINCSEPIRHESQQKFLRRFQAIGLRPSALSTCYAMAETTFAVTQTAIGTVPTVLAIDRNELSGGRIRVAKHGSTARICVSSGKPISGCELKIVDESGQEVDDGMIGELAIQSESMFEGYRNYPEKTGEVLRNGWYYSGDYGFKTDDEYYIVGRKKDVIIIAGNNIYPEDVEAALGSVDGIIPGRVIAFGEEDENRGTECLAVMAETSATDERLLHQLRMKLIQAGMDIDVSISKVYLVPPRFLIKSSAGKPSRGANRERLRLLSTTSSPNH
jgi:fatty-acyl-CoA synthase